MAEMKVEIDPAEAGFGADRLERIDRHFARYVDDGRPPGWLLAGTRAGRVVHVSTYGPRDAWAGFPRLFLPGTEWNYGLSTDVLSRVVEVAPGQRLATFFEERIFRPLAMDETAFFVDGADAERLAALYTPDPTTGKATRL